MVEVVISVFLAVVGMLLVITLFHVSLQRDNRANLRKTQALFAERVLASTREWALDPDHFLSDWSSRRGSFTDPDFPGFEATLDCQPLGRALYSPSSNLETIFPTAQRRKFQKSVVPVRVEVEGRGLPPVRLLSYVPEPDRELPALPRIQVSWVSGSNPIPQGATVEFQARMLDQAGREIEDVVYQWFVVPQTGNGTLHPEGVDRNRHRMRFEHGYTLPGGIPAFASGQARIRVVARYRGRIYSNGDPPEPELNLQ